MAFFSRPSSSAVKIVAPQTSASEPSSPKPSRKGRVSIKTKAVSTTILLTPTSAASILSPQPESNFDHYEDQDYTTSSVSIDDLSNQFQNMDPDAAYEQYPMDYDGAAMDVFYPQSAFIRQPLNYHLYTQPRPEALQHKYFVSDEVREELQKRSEAIHTGPLPGLNLPEELQGYHTLTPLEPISGERRKFGNWFSTVYKAVNSTDGFTYAFRRIENFRLNTQSAFGSIETWSRIKHPNLITVKEAFTTRAFNDSLVFDYYPNSQTLYDLHLKPKPPQLQNGRLQAQNARVPERTVWSYIIQIAGAIRAVHEAGLAVRIVDATKILVTGKNRVRCGSCGIVDIILYETRQEMSLLQQEDLSMLGKLVFSLCCNNMASMNNLPKAIDNLSRHYSQDLKNVALFLISKPSPIKVNNQL
ncbi:hypothetical protein EIP86_004669 [Pleurotus ostreatoroseus]|nr:hypothetical protein EIP86_004669 [Pleurotus ostreatoroseus]